MGVAIKLRSLFGLGGPSRPRPIDGVPADVVAAILGANHSGEWITPENCLTIPAVYAAVNAISSDLATLPLELRRPTPAGGSEVVADHPAALLFSRSPDGSTTPQQFLRALVARSLTWGDGYARIDWSGGYPVRLKLLDPAAVKPVDGPEGVDYVVGGEAVAGSRILHVAELGLDGVTGLSPVELCRQTLGVSRAAESYAAQYFGNGAVLDGYFTVPAQNQEKLDGFRENLRKLFGGANRHAPSAFSTGTEYKRIGGSPQESQLLEVRAFQLQEVARIFRIPPHKIGDASKLSYASAEQANLSYYLESLRPRCEALEAALALKLLTETELSAGWFWRFDFSALLRTDLAARAGWIRNLAASGLLRVDEGRDMADLPPIGGDKGAEILVPLNTGPLSKVVDPSEPKP